MVPHPAGAVRALVPFGYLLRGQAPAFPAQRSAPVYWQDTVRTEAGGRVRIGLLDGSVLNVGSQSSLTIAKHDPAAQQTQLELTYGRVRFKAVRITQPGGSFEVRTPVAVTGVVGTGFDVTSTNDLSVVLCLEDSVRVRNADDRVAGEVILHAGEFTRVQRGMPPTPASPATPQQIRESQEATSIAAAPVPWSRAEISWPPPGCGEEMSLSVRAWSKQVKDGKEIETPVDSELVDGKLLLGTMTVAVEGGRAPLANAAAASTPEGAFFPEGLLASIPTKVWPPLKTLEGQGWRAPYAAFVGSAFYILGPVGTARQVSFTFTGAPATLLWVGPCGMGLLAPMVPGGIYQVVLSVNGKPLVHGSMNLVQVSYDLPRPPALMRGQTTRFGIELRGLAGLDRFVQGRPVEVTTVINTTPAILGEMRSATPGAGSRGDALIYRVGPGNVDSSGTVRLDATGRGRQTGAFNLSVENRLDEALEQPRNPLTPVPPKP